MASSSRENAARGNWEIKSSPNGLTKEKLTLHVKKRRQSGDLRNRRDSPSSEASSKKSKRTKKGAKGRGGCKSNTPTRRQTKEESTGSEGANGESPDPEEEGATSQIEEAALLQARQEFINNAILEEILNEKKRVF
jgi:hypothetical protein